MNKIRQKLIEKINNETDFNIDDSWQFFRRNLTWSQKSAGCFKWYFYKNGIMAGSSENMKDLLKAKNFNACQNDYNDIEFSTD